MVKADAYGHGAVEVSRAAVSAGVDMLGVATLQEGIELRQAGIAAPVLILSPPMENETRDIIEYDLACSVPSLGIARALSRVCVDRGKTGSVHVEVDTGMGRSGVGLDEALPFVTAVGKLPSLSLDGVYTHFPASDDDAPLHCGAGVGVRPASDEAGQEGDSGSPAARGEQRRGPGSGRSAGSAAQHGQAWDHGLRPEPLREVSGGRDSRR